MSGRPSFSHESTEIWEVKTWDKVQRPIGLKKWNLWFRIPPDRRFEGQNAAQNFQSQFCPLFHQSPESQEIQMREILRAFLLGAVAADANEGKF